MLRFVVGTLGIIMGFFGLFTNLYILLILVLHKKTRSSSEWILLHLSSCGIGASFCNIFFSSPSIIWESWLASEYPFCDLIGAFILIIQFLTVWSICALSADRCAAIVSPLRYTQVVTRKRVAAYFFTVWALSLVTVILAFFFSTLREINTNGEIPVETNDSLQYFPTGESLEQVFPERTNDDHYPTPPFLITDSSHDTQITQTHAQLIEVMDLTFRLKESARAHNGNAMIGIGIPYDGSFPEETQSVLISPGSEVPSSHGDTGSRTNKGDVLIFEFRPLLGLCLPRVHELAWTSLAWTLEWVIVILIGPLCTLLICDLIVLSIARRQRHRIVMALYQITLSAQATVTRTKGTTPPSLWMNRTVPAKSKACRAVWEDLGSVFIINSPTILIMITECVTRNYVAPEFLLSFGSVTFSFMPIYNALLYGVRARPIRATVRSYMRKRMTNSTLQHEIQQRLSPVDGSPRPSSRAKSFRSSTPSPNSSISDTPRRLSTNDLRPPPPINFYLTTSPSHGHLGRHLHHHHHETNHVGVTARKVRSFLHIPTNYDMHEFWSGLRKPQRSPTIVITHEIRLKDSVNSLVSSSSSPLTNAEHML